MTSQDGNPTQISMQFHCTQCGGELHPDEGQIFLTCPFCGTTVYLDKSRVVFHWYVAPTINQQEAQGALFRWMSGSHTVKDLDKKARVVSMLYQFFPLWYFKVRTTKGEEIVLQPAAATAVTELARLHLPAGDLRRYESTLDGQSQSPTVPLDAGLDWLRQRMPEALPATTDRGGETVTTAAVNEMALVHVPVYICKYVYNGASYTALVEASSGTVLANLFPAKSEAPYRMVGCVTALVYLVLALVLAGALVSDSASTLGIGAGVCIGLGGLAAPALFAWAFWVASKV